MANEVNIVIKAQDLASSTVDRSTASMRSSLDGLRGPLLAVSAAFAATAGAAIKFASDLGESRNAMRTTFGEASKTVEEFSKTSASSYGVSTRAANEYTAAIGGILKASGLSQQAAADMSVDVVKLAADLGSFKNLQFDVALEKIRAGLVGEIEPLRSVGVLLNASAVEAQALKMGLVGAGEELTEGAKVLARYALILEQTKDAQGDFGKTLGESLPNQIKATKAELENVLAEIGNNLIPVALAGAQALNTVVSAFADLPEPVQQSLLAIGGVIGVLAAVASVAVPATAALSTMTASVIALNAAMLANPVVLAAVGAGLAAAAVGWVTYTTLSEAARDANHEFASSTRAALESLDADKIREAILDYEYLRRAIVDDIAAMREQGQATTELEHLTAELDIELKKLRDGLQQTTVSAEELGLEAAATRGPLEAMSGGLANVSLMARQTAVDLANLSAEALATSLAMQFGSTSIPEEMDAQFNDAVDRVRRQIARSGSLKVEAQNILNAADPGGALRRSFETQIEDVTVDLQTGLSQTEAAALKAASALSGGGGGGSLQSAAEELSDRLREAAELTADRNVDLANKAMREAEEAARALAEQHDRLAEAERKREQELLANAQGAAGFAQRVGATSLGSQAAIAQMFGFAPPELNVTVP